ncbi:MAG TPA: biotin transporter BioY [Anaerolineae bacterium]|nr:biotin transporter BioY [Anaerolineae bacterium]
MSNYPQPTIATTLWPTTSNKFYREAILILGGSWFLALLAQLSFNIGPVPITGQTFGVLLIGALYGWRRGGATMLAYITQGALGLPIFANAAAGPAALLGPTGGYIVGFIFAAALVGFLSQIGWDRRFSTTFLAMLLGNLVIYLFGVSWLANAIGFSTALDAGLIPFIPGDILKALLAAALLPSIWHYLNK